MSTFDPKNSAQDAADALGLAISSLAQLGPASPKLHKPVTSASQKQPIKYEYIQELLFSRDIRGVSEITIKLRIESGNSLRQNMQVILRDMYRVLNPEGVWDSGGIEFIKYIDELIAKGVDNGS